MSCSLKITPRLRAGEKMTLLSIDEWSRIIDLVHKIRLPLTQVRAPSDLIKLLILSAKPYAVTSLTFTAWLPGEHRVTYKLAVLTFNVRLTATPAYMNSLISNRVTASRMSLRSSTRSLMAVPRTYTVYASRSFSVCAPVVWNSLPPEIQLCSCLKPFKSKLKTFLFRRAFNI